MTAITKALNEALTSLGLSQTDFAELAVRLLDYGVLAREDSNIETTLYDRFLVCEELVEDYFSVLGIRLDHDRTYGQVRLFPPGSAIPGQPEDEHSPWNGGLRNRPNAVEVSAMLALRAEYEQALRAGQLDDRGQVLLPVEGLALALQNLLGRSLPEQQTERRQLLRRLRQLRLINYSSEDALENADGEAWLTIQPGILRFVNDDVLQALLANLAPIEAGTASAEASAAQVAE